MREEARAAAKWWAEVLRGPPLQDNGDLAQSMIGSIAASRSPELAEEELGAFEEVLAGEIERKASNSLLVTTDYGPDPFLALVLDKTGKDIGGPRGAVVENAVKNRLPWKTAMRIEPGLVEVSRGYGAPFFTIFLASPDTEGGGG